MKQAFLIVAHKNFDQLVKLVEYIADEEHHVYLHIDKKSENLFHQLRDYFKTYEYVYLLKKQISVNWGGFSQVQATLLLLESAYKQQYDFYHLISGQDLFIKSKQTVDEFLVQYKGHQFLEVIDDEKNLWRIKGYYLLSDCRYSRSRPCAILNDWCSKFFKKFPIRKNLKGFKIYKGANWFTLSGDCTTYIMEYLKKHPEYIRGYKYTLCADEHFFQTLILNSSFKDTVINETLREIQWNGQSNPKVYTINDYEMLKQSTALFARKFDSYIDHEIIEKIYKDIAM